MDRRQKASVELNVDDFLRFHCLRFLRQIDRQYALAETRLNFIPVYPFGQAESPLKITVTALGQVITPGLVFLVLSFFAFDLQITVDDFHGQIFFVHARYFGRDFQSLFRFQQCLQPAITVRQNHPKKEAQGQNHRASKTATKADY